MKKIRFTETVLRDANQSLMATRMSFDSFCGILPQLDRAGYYSLECWGGATFDSCLRYLDEDPWQRLRKIKAACPNTKLQMLLRGQNLLGYKHYPDDVVERFVAKAVENGIDIIRIFDALNDLRNIETAVRQTLKSGAIASGTICYTQSPIHTLDSYVKLAGELESMGVNTICIKDMAGILSPSDCFELVTEIKKSVQLPLCVHTHSTTGLGMLTLLAAAQAGADVIDTATAVFSGGTSQPATQTLAHALEGYGYDTGLDSDCLKSINDFFKPVWQKAVDDKILNPLVLTTDTDALSYQIPGGMLSNLVAQLTAAGKLELLDEVLRQVPLVRRDLGYPPLVTPMSQMVGAQAASNVLCGKAYQSISKQIESYVEGFYGKAPGEISEELKKRVLQDRQPITCRFADTLEPMYEKAKAEIGELAKCEEDVLSYIAFPVQAKSFFEKREQQKRRTYSYSVRLLKEDEQ